MIRSHGLNNLILRRIDAKAQPRENALLQLVTYQLILHKRIPARLQVRLQQEVLVIRRARLLIVLVRRQPLHGVDEILVKVHLPDMRCPDVDDGVVGQRGSGQVRQDVDVNRAARVVARKDGLKVHGAVAVCPLDAAEPRRAPGVLPSIISVFKAFLDYAAIDADGIGF